MEYACASKRKTRKDKFKITPLTRKKIEERHRVNIEDLFNILLNPKLLIEVEEQPPRRKGDKSYALIFDLTKRKKFFVLLTFKSTRKKVYIVTAYYTYKKTEKNEGNYPGYQLWD